MNKAKITLLALTLILLATPAAAETSGWGAAATLNDGDFGVQVRKDFWLGGDISQITGQAGIIFDNTIWARPAEGRTQKSDMGPGQSERD